MQTKQSDDYEVLPHRLLSNLQKQLATNSQIKGSDLPPLAVPVDWQEVIPHTERFQVTVIGKATRLVKVGT